MTVSWIPVTERLPEGEDAVSCEAWCLGEDGEHPDPCIMMYDADAPEGERWQSREDTGCWEPGEVTHWRPRSKGPAPTGMVRVGFICKDDLAQLLKDGSATVYEERQEFRLLPEVEQFEVFVRAGTPGVAARFPGEPEEDYIERTRGVRLEGGACLSVDEANTAVAVARTKAEKLAAFQALAAAAAAEVQRLAADGVLASSEPKENDRA